LRKRAARVECDGPNRIIDEALEAEALTARRLSMVRQPLQQAGGMRS